METLSELQIWIEGKFELVTQAQKTTHDDLITVRKTVHDLANDVSVILALNIPEKLSQLQKADEVHQANIDKFLKEAAERRGAMSALKVVYLVAGAAISFVGTIAYEFYKLVKS